MLPARWFRASPHVTHLSVAGCAVELRSDEPDAIEHARRLFYPATIVCAPRSPGAASLTLNDATLERADMDGLAAEVRNKLMYEHPGRFHVDAAFERYSRGELEAWIGSSEEGAAEHVVLRRDAELVTYSPADSDRILKPARHIREIALRRMENAGWTAFHASVVAIGGAGVMIPGVAGAGKTTTALAFCRWAGASFVANDRVLVRRTGLGQLRIVALPVPIRIAGPSLELLELKDAYAWPILRPKPPSDRLWSDSKAEKLQVLPHELHKFAGIHIAGEVPLAAVVVPVNGADLSIAAIEASCFSPLDPVYQEDWLRLRDRDINDIGQRAADHLKDILNLPRFALPRSHDLREAIRRIADIVGPATTEIA